MNFNLRLIQVLSDALIPVLGYLFWDWDLFFILLYYLLDLLISEIFMCFKSRSISSIRGLRMRETLAYFIVGMIIVSSILLLLRIFMLNLHPEINLIAETVEFWRYKDLGIEQGYILLPLLILVGYQRYKTEFIKSELHKKTSLKELWVLHYRELLRLLGYTGLISATSFIILFPEWMYLILLLFGTTVYQLRR
jgi:hypothetical protein